MTPLHTLITTAPFLTPEQKAQYLARIPELTPEGVAEITRYLTQALAEYEKQATLIDDAIINEEKKAEIMIGQQYKNAQHMIENLVEEGEAKDMEEVLTQL